VEYKTFELSFHQKQSVWARLRVVVPESSKMIHHIPNVSTCLSPRRLLDLVQPMVLRYMELVLLYVTQPLVVTNGSSGMDILLSQTTP
jgi:hypothetical protein